MQVAELSSDLIPNFIELYHEIFPHKNVTESEISERTIFVHTHGQEVMSFILFRCVGHEVEILDVGVRVKARRRGLACELLREAFARARQKKIKKIFLEVSESNSAAIALYKKFDFVAVGRRKKYYPDGTDALTFACTPSI